MQQQQISSMELMDRAAKACVEELLRHFDTAHTILIIAGSGNNGGDGIAMARILSDRQFKVTLFRLPAEKYSQDNTSQWERLNHANLQIVASWDPGMVHQYDLVVDALLGIGVNRALTGLLAGMVNELNASACPVLSIDLPSGLPAEQAFDTYWPVIRAKHTFTLGSYKLNLLLPHAAPFVGRLSYLDIGLSTDYKATLGVIGQVATPAVLAQHLPRRSTFSHKGSFGHALLIVGSEGKLGAAVLAGKACVRTGAGLTTLAVPKVMQATLAGSLPEAMSLASGVDFWTNDLNMANYTAAGIGPGLGAKDASLRALIELLATAACPLVLDADALNLLSTHPSGLALIPRGSILTPHVKEFDRLFGQHPHWWSRLTTLQAEANQRDLIIVLKNAYTFVAVPHATLSIHVTGNPGLAKGGSGDVLTGMITALLAQGLPASAAAGLGVYLHGSSADVAAKEFGESALMASDVIASIPEVVAALNFHQMN